VRIWDISPGYLSRQSLLGEHRELHGLVSILVHGKSGYSRHPETKRWVGHLPALKWRHAVLAAEMTLRGYADRTPIACDPLVAWPDTFVTAPGDQLRLLAAKYRLAMKGRIPLPASVQELWAHHKYSVMARDQELYRTLGRRVSRMRRGTSLAPLAAELVQVLRREPPGAELVNAVEHIWGHVSTYATAEERARASVVTHDRFGISCGIAVRIAEPYLMASTALGELGLFTQAAATSSTRSGRAAALPGHAVRG
jgi:uncharacterized protein YbgA (DUF1722 family)